MSSAVSGSRSDVGQTAEDDGHSKSPRARAVLEQFYVYLEAKYQSARRALPPDDGTADAARLHIAEGLTDIRNRLDEKRSWPKARLIEQLLSTVIADEQLPAELDYWLVEAKAIESPYATEITAWKATAGLPGTLSEHKEYLREAIRNLIAEVQWFKLQRYHYEKSRSRFVKFSSWMFVGIFAVIIFVLFSGLMLDDFVMRPIAKFTEWIGLGNDGVIRNYGIVTAVVFGLFGASYGVLNSLSTSSGSTDTELADTVYTLRSLFTRLLIGTGGALIIYFFFESGVLSGAIIPDLKELAFIKIDLFAIEQAGNGAAKPVIEANQIKGGPDLYVPNSELSLLMVWSTLAGFSENIVSTILSRAEAQEAASAKKGGQGGAAG